MKYLLKSTLAILLLGMFFTSCDDDVAELESTNVTFSFSHNFDGTEVTASEFNALDFINANNDTLSLTKLRYLVSDIRLFKTDGDSITLDAYQLVDVTNTTGLTFDATIEVPQGTYTGVSFTFGFDSLKNIDNGYADLNAASWNWPDQLGGGYHFMQMEGMWMDQGVSKPYAYHHGTARASAGVFEQNYFTVDLGGVTLNRANANINIEMDIAEWYKNPYTWDFSTYSTMLMPNYDAQILMHGNGQTVFSLGKVNQAD